MRVRSRKGGRHASGSTWLTVGIGTAVAGVAGYALASALTGAATPEPWFGGYVDVTLSPHHDFRHPGGPDRNVVLAFIVADPEMPCRAKWGTVYSADEAAATGLDQRIDEFRQNGGQVALSFGGAQNDELATVCRDVDALTEAYRSAMDRYDVKTIDLDIEEHNLPNAVAGERRARAMADLQAERARAGRPLGIWLTLPVLPTGLTPDGTTAVRQMLDAGVDVAGVNIMTMNYGASRTTRTGMLEASVQAAHATHSQLDGLYRQAGRGLGPRELWQKIGLTPMIGQNDVESDLFSLADARALNEFARAKGLGRVSMWSLSRDRTCGAGEHVLKEASPTCSGLDQDQQAFAELLGRGLTGRVP